MRFVIERMYLTDNRGAVTWGDAAPPEYWCDGDGLDAGAVLQELVAKDGGVQVGVTASFVDGQAITIARKGKRLVALRAVAARKMSRFER